ncbi:MAG TPA: 5-formyltetrahydrofolate cyclo-ligase [Haliangiales bacterium]|nr:5-formyltetrahydrofolate cyclo-ligase [Haliangiales bacterium]
MSQGIGQQKTALRQRVRSELKRLSPAGRLAASERACWRLRQEPIWREARSVLLYAPLPDEVDIGPLLTEALAAGKELALPRFDTQEQMYLARRVLHLTNDLRPGRFGIAEPAESCPDVPLKRLDFILAPGVAFAWDGRRLGRGKGYYDRLLSFVRGVKCGIAFDEQMMDDIPAEPHDVRMDYILTPTRWTRAGRSGVLK